MEKFFYQYLAKDAKGNVLKNQNIGLSIFIYQKDPLSKAIFSETHKVKSDANGLLRFRVGSGTPWSGNLDSLEWGKDTLFIEVQQDLKGGTAYASLGTFELMPPVNEFFSGIATAKAASGNKNAQGTCGSFIVAPDGNAGVGNLNPQHKLDVEGNIRLTGQMIVDDAILKVTNSSASPINHSNLFLGWENGNTEGTVAKFENVVIGHSAGKLADNMNMNVLIGKSAGEKLSGNSRGNISIGNYAGMSDAASQNTNNICIGEQAGQKMSDSMDSNIIIGEKAGQDATGCSSSVFVGRYAGQNNQADYNIFIGHNCGHHNTTGEANTFVGSMDTGINNTTGRWNTFIGGSCGENNVSGNYNAYLGHSAGHRSNGSGNTIVGHGAGHFCYTGNENVFIGHFAGKNENGNHKLYIANTETATPLVYGEFDNQKLVLNGNVGVKEANPERPLHVKDVMRLEPRSGAPSSPKEGDIYMDRNDHKLKVYDGTQWQACW